MQATALNSTQPRAGFDAWQAGAQAGARIGLDRFRDAPASTAAAPLTPVQRGVAAREADAVAKAPRPIHVSSTVVRQPDGTKLTTIYIDVRANFSQSGGVLPSGRTAAAEARAIERAIERDFSKSYKDKDGSVTRYVARVNMTVGQPASADREQFVLVPAGDARLGGGAGTLGRAPDFEKGHIAYISDAAGARTAPHEFGHLAGLRHTAQVDQGCTTAPGIKVDNLMSQTGCSPTSQRLERQQLQQIYRTPDFR